MEQQYGQHSVERQLNFDTFMFYGDSLASKDDMRYIPRTVPGTYQDISTMAGTPKSVRNDIYYLETHDCGVTVDEYLDLTTDTARELTQYIWDEEQRAFITDDHGHALAAWTAAYQEGMFDGDVRLVHVDAHPDDEEPLIRMKEAPTTVDAADNYIGQEVSIKSFIQPAVEWGLIDEVKNWGVGPGESISETYSIEELDQYIQDTDTLVMDIDLDVFTQDGISCNEDDISPEDLYETLAAGIESAAVTTIATSPGYIDQDIAIDHLYNIFESVDS